MVEISSQMENEKAMKTKLEREVQVLDNKLTVMQEFYAKREVEIQGYDISTDCKILKSSVIFFQKAGQRTDHA